MRILFAFLLSVFMAQAAVTPGGGGGGGGSYTTNVLSVTNAGLRYVSPLPGNNGVTDMRTNQPNFVGQIGVGVDAPNAGSGIYLYGASSNKVGGYDSQFYFPAGIAQIGSEWSLPTNSNYRFAWNYLNGNAKWATRTNIVNGVSSSFDSGWGFAQMNPYGCALLWTPTTTTNVQYKWTAGGIIGTNATGDVIYWDEDPFGLVMGTISRAWPAQETNQAGSYVILMGGGGSTKPFHIADNHSEGGQLGQFSYLTVDRRGLSNVASPWGLGFPIRTTNAWSETNANFRWGLWHDYKTGQVHITNALTTLHSIFLNNSNSGANLYGRFAEADNGSTEHNFAGGVSFNAPANTGFNEAWTFDAAAAHRLGFIIQAGNYPTLTFAKGSDFRITQSSATDLQSGISTQTQTNMLSVSNNVLAVHTPGFRVDGNQTNVGNYYSASGGITLGSGAISLPGNGITMGSGNQTIAFSQYGGDLVGNGLARVKRFNFTSTSANASAANEGSLDMTAAGTFALTNRLSITNLSSSGFALSIRQPASNGVVSISGITNATPTTPGTVAAWIPVTLNGTNGFIPFYQ